MEYLKPGDKSSPGIDRYGWLILKATRDSAKSAVELSKKYGIPIAKCFKKIKKLEREGYLLEAKKVSTKEGKEVSLYRSDFDDELQVCSRPLVKT